MKNLSKKDGFLICEKCRKSGKRVGVSEDKMGLMNLLFGEAGNNNQPQALWQCQNCGTQVYGNKNIPPYTQGCPAGGHHRWFKLTN